MGDANGRNTIEIWGDAHDEHWVREAPDDYDEDTPSDWVPQAAADPDPARDFWKSREVLTHIHDFAQARRTSPLAMLGVELARVVTSIKPFVCLPAIVGGDASLNLFVALVGRSGAGKGASETAAAEAILLPDQIHVSHAGSGEGIAHEYMRREKGGLEQHNDSVLFSMPEIDSLTALGSRQGATLLPQLRQAWMGERLGFGYADPTKRLPVPAHKYRMTLVLGVQPGRAATLLDDTDAGTPQRFLWLPAVDPAAPELAPPCPEPITWRRPTFPDADYHTNRSALPICDEAHNVIDAARLARLRGDGDALDGHALLNRLKIAAALGLLDGHAAVTRHDWHLAGQIIAISDETRTGVRAALQEAKRVANRGRAEGEAERTIIVADRVADTATRRVARGIIKHLRRTDHLSRGQLRKRFSGPDREHVDAALELLLDAGQIEVEPTERDQAGHGGTGTRYRLAKGVT